MKNIDDIARWVSLLITVVYFYCADLSVIMELVGFTGLLVLSFYTWIFYIDKKIKG